MATFLSSTKHPAASPQAPVAVSLQQASRGWVRRLTSGILTVVVILIGVSGIGVLSHKWSLATIDTGSMRPALSPGDVAILRPEPLAQLRVGQIVAFHPPHEASVTIIHRIVTLSRESSGVVIQTKGDANNARDQWKAFLPGSTAWVEWGAIPKLGYVTVMAQMAGVRFAILLALVGIAVTWGWRQLWPAKPRLVENGHSM
ncbi:MAG TPA: signal peptidase I [Chloroflexota bacterium]|nr:signal peptidase I [Chloroflexota bacterium]